MPHVETATDDQVRLYLARNQVSPRATQHLDRSDLDLLAGMVAANRRDRSTAYAMLGATHPVPPPPRFTGGSLIFALVLGGGIVATTLIALVTLVRLWPR